MPVPPTSDNPHGWGPDPKWLASLLQEFRYSPKVTLKPGDHIRLSQGPFYRSSDGTKKGMGFRGPAVIKQIEDHPRGVVLHCVEVTKTGSEWGYLAARVTGDTIPGLVDCMVSRPHKVVKCRVPHRIAS